MDWAKMTRWQRLDLLLRHRKEAERYSSAIKQKPWQGILGALVSRILGV